MIRDCVNRKQIMRMTQSAGYLKGLYEVSVFDELLMRLVEINNHKC